MWEMICINWTGQTLSGEERLVIRNVAAAHLRAKKKGTTIHFTHPLCDGLLTRKEDSSFGTFGGAVFHADLGTRGGERLTMDFLIPRNSEWMMIEDDSVVVTAKRIPGGDIGVKRIDASKARGAIERKLN